MIIDRCFCFQTTFAELAEVASSTGAATVCELQEHVTFGQKCQLCHPYTRRMLRTGETVFHQIVTEADEPEVEDDKLAMTSDEPNASPAR